MTGSDQTPETSSSYSSPNDDHAADTAVSSETAQTSDIWPLEADRYAVHSPLIECLRIVAGHYGRRTSENALTAGLPNSTNRHYSEPF